MKKIYFLVVMIISYTVKGQIAQYNSFPTMQPQHILDENKTDISFAFSMRILESDYNGPLIRLRRAGDNAEEDFFHGDNDSVDTDAIDAWRGTNDVFVQTWYDQSGLNRNAVQTTITRQPRFYTNATQPYFQGDGVNDYLSIDTPNGIQDVTNNGNQGTVIAIMRASRKSQHSFGVLTGRDRWSAHINWSNNNVYFDPGICCNAIRNFSNTPVVNVNPWTTYTFVKTSTNVIARQNKIEKFNGLHTTGRCTRTEDFAIGWAEGNETGNHATTAFTEFIMYRTNVNALIYNAIEDNAIAFWSL